MASATPVMLADHVKPTSLPVHDLLAHRYPARVPRYQRPYAWDDEHVSDLIEDLTKIMPTRTGTRGHFYGGMVAITVPLAGQAQTTAYEVVDGQQRLATFCLLLSRIALAAGRLRDEADQDGKKPEAGRFRVLAAEIRASYLYYQRFDVDKGQQQSEPRLRLSVVDDAHFQGLLEGNAPAASRDSHRLLDQAVKLLDENLVHLAVVPGDRAKSMKQLKRLRDAVLRDSFVIHIVGDTRANGYRLFAVLNDRGARLTVADLLRSHTLEMLDAHPKTLEQTALLWDDMLQEGGDEVDRFLQQYYASLEGKRVSPSDLFDKTRDLLFPGPPPAALAQADELRRAVAKMREHLGWFLRLRAGAWPFPAGGKSNAWERARLKRLVDTLKHELADPLLLAARAAGDEKKFAELVHVLELFAFRYKNVCNAHTSPASRAYYDECKRLRALPQGTSPNWAPFRAALRQLVEARAGDQLFAGNLGDRLRYDTGSRANIRELLTVLEEYGAWTRAGATGKPKPDTTSVTDLNQVTLEHVYPQNPSPADPLVHPHRHRLGNLSFWSPADNGAADNDDFATKKPLYAASGVRLNQDLANHAAWDLPAIEQRERELIDEACMVFRV
jgi:hypothetical protein